MAPPQEVPGRPGPVLRALQSASVLLRRLLKKTGEFVLGICDVVAFIVDTVVTIFRVIWALVCGIGRLFEG
ncbi:hypothetical protein [Deinococcus arcticus]|uniref:hypothetical protein n=1 Tax=Deinococcus arcticus TaxID=2136176 RepID=UPI0011B2221F|nr:hypothetical protein [Deinococcus arcticus]